MIKNASASADEGASAAERVAMSFDGVSSAIEKTGLLVGEIASLMSVQSKCR